MLEYYKVILHLKLSLSYILVYIKKDLKEKRFVMINAGTGVGPKVTDVRKL